MTTTEPGSVLREVALAWHRDQHERLCDRVEPWQHGYLARSSDFPAYWDYNLVVVERDDPALDAPALLAIADTHHGDLSHRKIQVAPEDAGRRLRRGLEGLGFTCAELIFMVHGGPLPAAPEGFAFRPAEDAAARPLRGQWYASEPWLSGPRMLEEFLDEKQRAHERLGGHVLLVDGDGPGGLAAYVRVQVPGATGEIAEAYAVPEARGRGIGGALVTAGIREIARAGAEHVLIVADAAERAQHLYERLGFRPVWRMHDFTRRPGTPSP